MIKENYCPASLTILLNIVKLQFLKLNHSSSSILILELIASQSFLMGQLITIILLILLLHDFQLTFLIL